ncbi:MAG: hypothetical protein ACI9OJ_004051, partial [Myxococcota bacterium]
MTNQEYLVQVAQALGGLTAELVFTGGLVVQEYYTVPAQRQPRVTIDADAICKAASYVEYRAFGERLSAKGFVQSATSGTPPY